MFVYGGDRGRRDGAPKLRMQQRRVWGRPFLVNLDLSWGSFWCAERGEFVRILDSA